VNSETNEDHAGAALRAVIYLTTVIAVTAMWIAVVSPLDVDRIWMRLSWTLPSLVAIVFLIGDTSAARQRFLATLAIRPRTLVWLAFAAVTYSVLVTLASWFSGLLFHPEFELALNPIEPGAVLLIVLWSLGEELGWRGYALPTLARKIGWNWASLVVGVAWWAWHTPGWLVGFGAPGDVSYLVFGAWVVSASFVFTAFFRLSGGSALVAVLLHAGANTAFQIVPIMPGSTGGPEAFNLLTGLNVVVALAGMAVTHFAPSCDGESPRRSRNG